MKRATALPALVLVAAMLGLGCGGSDTAGGGGGGAARIDFQVFGDAEELAAYRQLVAAYARRRTGKVRLIEVPDREAHLQKIATGFASGAPPEVFLVNYRNFAGYAARGALDPAGPRLDASKVLRRRAFYSQPVKAFTYRGALQCVPQNVSSLVVYYNRDLFRRGDVAEPEAGWTWDDMVERALALTRDVDGDGNIDVHGLGVEPSMIRVAPFVWSNGGEVVDDDERPTRFVLDRPQAVAALQAFFDLRQTHLVVPSEQEVEAEDDETRFQNGRMAMVLSSRRSTPAFRTITAFDWDVAPLPVHEQAAGILHSDAYCMAAASDSKDAAWRFVEFALGPRGQRIAARTGRTVPSLRAIAESRAFLDPEAKPASSRVFLDSIASIRRVPSISTWPEIEDASEGILESGLYQGVPAKEVARRLIERTTPMFARAEH